MIDVQETFLKFKKLSTTNDETAAAIMTLAAVMNQPDQDEEEPEKPHAVN